MTPVLRATLKKPWTSYHGKSYPIGTTFVFKEVMKRTGYLAYAYSIPGVSYGMVIFKWELVFRAPTETSTRLRDIRKALSDEHMQRTRDKLIFQ